MTLSYAETEVLIDLVLRSKMEDLSKLFHAELRNMGRREPEFYDGVILHGPFMKYSSEQWFDFHFKVPHWRLRDEKALMDKLSESQRQRLPEL